MRPASPILLALLASCGGDRFTGEDLIRNPLPDAFIADSRGVGGDGALPEGGSDGAPVDSSQAPDAWVPDGGADSGQDSGAVDSATGWDGACGGCRWAPGTCGGQLTCDFTCPYSCTDPPPTLTQGPSGCLDYPDGGELVYCCPKSNPGCQ